jgi:hypothetical protein
MVDAYRKISSCQPKVKELIMANHLPIEKKALVLSLLTEGQSIRATSRITDVDTKTIMSLLVKAGDKARDIHDTMMQNLQCKRIQADEVWCVVAKKQKRVKIGEENECGDFYTFVAIDPDTKLVPCYRVGKRTGRLAASFMMELSIRVPSRFQLSTDSFNAYEGAVERVFGADIDYAQIHKEYEETSKGQRRYKSCPHNTCNQESNLRATDPKAYLHKPC